MKFGYTLSSEEFGPRQLIENGVKAEKAGFEFLGLSDHFHPWTSTQGQSPFSWSVVGGLAQATKKVGIFTEVVCPFMRYHPAVVAQAAATSQILSNGRFMLGVGTGEYLNEHIVAQGWPHIRVRRAMLAESIEVIQHLFVGKMCSYYGDYISLEAARLFTLPDVPPPIIVSAFGPISAALAGQMGDGLVCTAPNKEVTAAFAANGGEDKPRYAQIDVCFDKNAKRAKEIAYKQWPNAGLGGQLSTELRMPQYFEQASKTLTPEQVTKDIVCGANPKDYLQQIEAYQEAGFDHVYFHNIGPHQDEFIEFAQNEILPAMGRG